MQNYGFNVGGTLIKNKSSFSIIVNGSTPFDTPEPHTPAMPGGGTRSETLGPTQPSDNMFGVRPVRLRA